MRAARSVWAQQRLQRTADQLRRYQDALTALQQRSSGRHADMYLGPRQLEVEAHLERHPKAT